MAALKPAELKYGVPIRGSVGDYFLSIVQIETPASATWEPETAGQEITLDLTKLGFPVGVPAGLSSAAREGAVGETASTTALPVAVWASPLISAKLANEQNKVATQGFVVYAGIANGKVQLRLLGAPGTAAVGKPLLEPTNAGAAAVGNCVFTVFVLGK